MRLKPHPVSLLFASLVLSGCLIAIKSTAPLITLIILFLGIVCLSGIRLWPIGLKIVKLWPFLGLTFLLHAVLSGHPDATFSVFPRIDLNQTGLFAAAFFTARLAVILAVGIGLLQVYSPQQYSRDLARLLGKLPFWRKQTAHLELTIGLALQFVPLVEQEYQRLHLALAARGEASGGSVFHKLSQNRKLLFPLMLNTLRRADQVSLALEARGFDPIVRRTSLLASPVSKGEIIAVGLFVIACLASLWL